MRRASFLLLIPFLLGLGRAVEADGPSPADVRAAVERGASFLKEHVAGGFKAESWHDTAEIVMLTLAHAGVRHDDPAFQAGLKALETCDLAYTYRVSTLAMTLAHINTIKYRQRLAACAQWLVDTQLEGGEWGYPGSVGRRGRGPTAFRAARPEPADDDTPDQGAAADAPILIERLTDAASFRGAQGDFSNTQFALLGLRACREANIQVPEDTWRAALHYMRRFQHDDGGWGYVYGGEQDESGYASLTCAAAVGVAICLHELGTRRPMTHPAVKKALRWLRDRWKADQNVGIDRSSMLGPSSWQYYHLYAVERVGSVLRLKTIGDVAWYPAGATWLLEHQRSDGSWSDPNLDEGPTRREYLRVADTCFAILFLTRATPPLTR